MFNNILKVFAITPTTAIAFSGGVRTAATLLKCVIDHFPVKRSVRLPDGVALRGWLPRYLRHSYATLDLTEQVSFLVASVVPNQPNAVRRSRAVEVMDRIRTGSCAVSRNFVPGIFVRILQTPPCTEFVRLPEAPLGLLYRMHSPNFDVYELEPLEFIVVGSGADAKSSVNIYSDWIFAGDVGNPSTVSAALRDAIGTYIRRNHVETVGGMYPCIELGARGLVRVGHGIEIPSQDTRIELCPTADGRWVQRNHTTGKELTLHFPWEIDWSQYRQSQRFSDLDDALQIVIDGA